MNTLREGEGKEAVQRLVSRILRLVMKEYDLPDTYISQLSSALAREAFMKVHL